LTIESLKARPLESFCLWHFSLLIFFAPSIFFQHLSTLRNSKPASLVYHLFRSEKSFPLFFWETAFFCF
jgi:hypothetical protein